MRVKQIHRCPNVPALQEAAANAIARSLTKAIDFEGIASISLSGGATPKGVYELLAVEPLRSRVDWNSVHVFWGDERCVPPTDPQSNYLLTAESLLYKISIPPENIHRVLGELPPAEAATVYAINIEQFFRSRKHATPKFDIMLLGLGEDGHTASLFPGTPILAERSRSVADVYVEKLKSHRISLTFPVINNSKEIFFLVSGSGKAEVVRGILQEHVNRYPAELIALEKSEWFLDKDAASLMNN